MRRASVLAAAAIVAACGGNSRSSSPTGPTGPNDNGGAGFPAGVIAFHASPIAPNTILWITPLGGLNPPGHTTPTDHIYFYFANPNIGESPVARRTAFMAPGDGTVTEIFTGTSIPDVKVFVRVNSTTSYYIDHLIPENAITRGMTLTAGQRLGTTGSSYGVDLGVVNSTLTLGFVNPSRYAQGDSLHADAPLKYYEEPLRATLYDKVQRLGSERDGKIDFDVAARLSGNWFVQGGTASLAFVYDTYDPSQVRISVTSGFILSGVFAIAGGELDPRVVSAADGKVRYTLMRSITGPNPGTGGPVGRMLVQMLDDQRIRVEIFGLTEDSADFTTRSWVFTR